MNKTPSEGGSSDQSSSTAKSSRRYSQQTLGLLWGLAGNTCANPRCTKELIAAPTEVDDAAIVAHIAHIVSSSDKGPRAEPDMPPEKRDSYENLLLLCRHCHGLVDAQDSTFTVEELRDWKVRNEEAFIHGRRRIIAEHINRVNFPELEAAARHLLAVSPSRDETLVVLPPEEKIRKNNLGSVSRFLLNMGASKSDEVERFIAFATQLDEGYAGRLRSGFVAAYSQHWEAGLRGDELFEGMRVFAGGRNDESQPRKIAGLAILSHLFILCEVFETE